MKLINQLDPQLITKRLILSNAQIIHFEDVSAIVYICKEPIPVAKGFSNKRIKPDFYFHFKSVESMEKYIANWQKSLKGTQIWKQEESEKRKAYVHDFKVGDILNTCWGYEQTNVAFYQVTKIISAKSIQVCEVAYERCADNEDHVKPCRNQFIGKPITRLVSVGGSIAIKQYIGASKFNDESIYRTPWYALR